MAFLGAILARTRPFVCASVHNLARSGYVDISWAVARLLSLAYRYKGGTARTEVTSPGDDFMTLSVPVRISSLLCTHERVASHSKMLSSKSVCESPSSKSTHAPRVSAMTAFTASSDAGLQPVATAPTPPLPRVSGARAASGKPQAGDNAFSISWATWGLTGFSMPWKGKVKSVWCSRK